MFTWLKGRLGKALFMEGKMTTLSIHNSLTSLTLSASRGCCICAVHNFLLMIYTFLFSLSMCAGLTSRIDDIKDFLMSIHAEIFISLIIFLISCFLKWYKWFRASLMWLGLNAIGLCSPTAAGLIYSDSPYESLSSPSYCYCAFLGGREVAKPFAFHFGCVLNGTKDNNS